MDNLPDEATILKQADERIRARAMKAHHDETELKGGAVAALGWKASLALARDSYEMGMRDALKAIADTREAVSAR